MLTRAESIQIEITRKEPNNVVFRTTLPHITETLTPHHELKRDDITSLIPQVSFVTVTPGGYSFQHHSSKSKNIADGRRRSRACCLKGVIVLINQNEKLGYVLTDSAASAPKIICIKS